MIPGTTVLAGTGSEEGAVTTTTPFGVELQQAADKVTATITDFQSPTGVEASFAHLWNDGGWFPKGLSGFFAGFQIAVFAFVGIELVGTTAAETKDPEKSLPRAINSIPIRIIMFYVFALIVIMSVTPWSSVVPEKSPFVELFVLVGLPAAASVINFVVLTSAASSANSGVFSTSVCCLVWRRKVWHRKRSLNFLSAQYPRKG